MIKWNPDKQLAQGKIAATIDAVTVPVKARGTNKLALFIQLSHFPTSAPYVS